MMSSSASWCSSSETHSSAEHSTSRPRSAAAAGAPGYPLAGYQLRAGPALPHRSPPLAPPWGCPDPLGRGDSLTRDPPGHPAILPQPTQPHLCSPRQDPPAGTTGRASPPGQPPHLSGWAHSPTAQHPPGPLGTSPTRIRPVPQHRPRPRSPLFSCCRSRICVFSCASTTCGRSRDGSGGSAAGPGPCRGDTGVGPAASGLPRHGGRSGRPARALPRRGGRPGRAHLVGAARARLPHGGHAPVQHGRLVDERLGRRVVLLQPLQQRPRVRQDLIDGAAHGGRRCSPPRRAHVPRGPAAAVPSRARSGPAAGRGRTRTRGAGTPLPPAATAPPARRRGPARACRSARGSPGGARAPRPGQGAGLTDRGRAQGAGPGLSPLSPGEARSPELRCFWGVRGCFGPRGHRALPAHGVPKPPAPGACARLPRAAHAAVPRVRAPAGSGEPGTRPAPSGPCSAQAVCGGPAALTPGPAYLWGCSLPARSIPAGICGAPILSDPAVCPFQQ